MFFSKKLAFAMVAITIYLLEVANLSLQRDLLHLAFCTNAKQQQQPKEVEDTVGHEDERTVEKAQQDQNNCALNMCLALRGATDTNPMGRTRERVCER